MKDKAAKPVPSRLCPPAPCPGALSPSPREPVPSFLPGRGLLPPGEWPGGPREAAAPAVLVGPGAQWPEGVKASSRGRAGHPPPG